MDEVIHLKPLIELVAGLFLLGAGLVALWRGTYLFRDNQGYGPMKTYLFTGARARLHGAGLTAFGLFVLWPGPADQQFYWLIEAMIGRRPG